MIIDTMYLLPLVGISIKTDLLRAIVERDKEKYRSEGYKNQYNIPI
ncbi:MAG: hypothetical protein ACP5GI_06580 [Sulfolobales archaeon]